MRGPVGLHIKTIEKRAKIEKVASICVVWNDFIQKGFKNESKLKRLLRFLCCLVGFDTKSIQQTGQNWKGGFDLHSLVGFHTKTIQKRLEIENVASIAWSNRSWYKNHSITGQNRKGCFDLCGLVWFPTKTIQK